jgi:hypothetical protein
MRRAEACGACGNGGELLESYLWSVQFVGAGTAVSHRHVVSTLLDDPLFRCRQQCLTPAVMRAAICRWREEGVSVPKVSARWLLLRSAVSWAVAEGLLGLNPLAGMRGVTGSASSGPETAAGPFPPAGGRRGADGAGGGGRRREIRMAWGRLLLGGPMQGMTWPPA